MKAAVGVMVQQCSVWPCCACSSWVPTHVVSQLDVVRLLKEKGLTDIPQTLEEMGLGKVCTS